MLDRPTRKQPDIKVTLLGTGGPELTRDRMGAATLIEAGGKPLLFDAGRGVLQRLYECGVHINSVTRVILTHLHSDHIDGLPNLWITPWFLLGRSEPMKFWGPHGTRKMLVGMRDFLGHDVTHRARVEEALFLADRIFVLSGRPGRLLREVDVPFERPRTDDTMRSELFHRMVDEMTAALDSTENAPQYAVESLD